MIDNEFKEILTKLTDKLEAIDETIDDLSVDLSVDLCIDDIDSLDNKLKTLSKTVKYLIDLTEPETDLNKAVKKQLQAELIFNF